MTFLELAKARYSVRSYKNTPIEEAKLDAILTAGKLAPTAANSQPQRIYVIRSAEAKEKLAAVCRFTYAAPILLLVCYDESRDWKNSLMPGYQSGETDAAIVCTHMMLEAWEQGIGSCWVGYFNADEVAKALGLPQGVRPSALLPIGYPADDAKPSAMHDKCRSDEEMIETL